MQIHKQKERLQVYRVVIEIREFDQIRFFIFWIHKAVRIRPTSLQRYILPAAPIFQDPGVSNIPNFRPNRIYYKNVRVLAI